MNDNCDVCGDTLNSDEFCENHCHCPSCDELTKEGYCETCDIDYNGLNDFINSFLNMINRSDIKTAETETVA